MDRKAIFFTIDAFTAISMIIVGIVIFVAFYFHAPFKSQVYYYSQDISNLFASTKIKDLNLNDMNNIKGMIEDDHITNTDNTLFQQIGEFYYRSNERTPSCSNCEAQISKFIEDIMNGRVSERFSYSILLYTDVDTYDPNGNAQYEYTHQATDDYFNTITSENSELQMSSKTLVSGQFNNSEFFGPYIIEVRVWQ